MAIASRARDSPVLTPAFHDTQKPATGFGRGDALRGRAGGAAAGKQTLSFCAKFCKGIVIALGKNRAGVSAVEKQLQPPKHLGEVLGNVRRNEDTVAESLGLDCLNHDIATVLEMDAAVEQGLVLNIAERQVGLLHIDSGFREKEGFFPGEQ
jgi:hypothetical protein